MPASNNEENTPANTEKKDLWQDKQQYTIQGEAK